MRVLVLFLIVGLYLFPQFVAGQASTRFVSTTGMNTNPASATSWATSTTDLQGAINSLSATGGEVWVAAGMYKPGGNANLDRTRSFSMRNGVGVYGGFVGSETTRSQRPIISLSSPTGTTLSGEIGNPTSTTDNSYHVISNPSGLAMTAILDGFVITGGNANGLFPHYTGGGIQNNGSGSICSPLIRQCIFLKNTATYGGAIFNDGFQGSSSPRIENCLFQENSASYGGAVYNDGFQGVSSPVLVNCACLKNTVSSDGGAVFNAGSEGGISNPTLVNCSFQGNTAPLTGGALFSIATSGTGNVALTNCIFWNNGGSITFANTSATVSATYCLLEPTVANYTSDPGTLTTVATPFIETTSLQLRNGNPAINAGNPATTAATVGETDLLGNPRFVGRIDMGAVEFQDQLEVYTLKDGSWNDSTVWSVGRLPQVGERVRLRHSVTIPISTNARSADLLYEPTGKLIYMTGGRLQLGN